MTNLDLIIMLGPDILLIVVDHIDGFLDIAEHEIAVAVIGLCSNVSTEDGRVYVGRRLKESRGGVVGNMRGGGAEGQQKHT